MTIQFKASSKSADAPEIEDGLYQATFKGIVEKKFENSQYPTEPDGSSIGWLWQFELVDQGDLVDLDSVTSQNMNVTSKKVPGAVRNLKGLLTRAEWATFLDGEGFDAPALIGRKCQVQVENDEKSGWPRIIAVIAMPTSKKKAAPVDDDD